MTQINYYQQPKPVFKKRNRKTFALKVIGLQIALIIALVLVQMAMAFFTQNRLLVIQSKNEGWEGIAMTAQATNFSCQQELDKANEQLEAFRKVRNDDNKDILKPNF